MSSASRMICVSGWRCPSGGRSPGSVTSRPSAASSLPARSSAACRSSTAASRRSRTAFSAMPVSRSRTSRSASFSSLFRPRNRTRSILERVGGVSRLDRAQSLVLERLGVHPPTVPSAFVTSRYDPFAAVYDSWAADMTEDVPFYVELARQAPDGPIVELAVGNGRVAIPVALETGRRVIGVDVTRRRCSRRRVCGPSRRAPTSSSARVTCATSRSTSRPSLVYCPFRALLHLPHGTTNGASSSAWRRASSREAASPGTRSASTTRSRRGSTGTTVDRAGSAHDPKAPGDNRVDIDARSGRHDLALVGDEVGVGRADRRGRARGGGALWLVRPAAVRRREPGVRVGDTQAGMNAERAPERSPLAARSPGASTARPSAGRRRCSRCGCRCCSTPAPEPGRVSHGRHVPVVGPRDVDDVVRAVPAGIELVVVAVERGRATAEQQAVAVVRDVRHARRCG